MNVAIVVILCAVFAVLGFFIGCFACTYKITDLEYKNKTLTEWLEAARTANNTLVYENEELRLDIEALVRGQSFFDRENKLYCELNEENETKTD